MSNTIDSLNFDFTASNINIDGKVDAIVEMMGKIAESIGKISPAKLNKISTGITTLATGLQSLTNVDANKLSNIADSIEKMKDIRGFNNVRKAMDGTKKSADALSKTKVNADFFSKSNAEKTITKIDNAYKSALNRFKDVGKDWKFDTSMGSAEAFRQELFRLKLAISSVYTKDILGKGFFDKEKIENTARSMSEVGNRLQIMDEYIKATKASAQKLAETKLDVPFIRAAEKAEEAGKSAQNFVSLLNNALNQNAGKGKEWIPPESINERRKALVEMQLQLQAIGEQLSRLSAQGANVDSKQVQTLANAYQTLRNQIANVKLPTGSFEDLDAKLKSILSSTNENPLLNGKLNPKIDWSCLSVGEEKVKTISAATEEVKLNFNAISKFQLPKLTFGTRFTDEAHELIKNIEKAEISIAKLKDRVSKMQGLGKMGSFGAKALHFDYDREVRRYNKMLDKFRELEDAGKIFEKLRVATHGLNFEPVALQNGEKYTRSYAKLVANIENARKSLDKLAEVQERMVHFGEDYGKAWEKNQYNIERTRERMAEYITQAHGMEQAGDAVVSSDKASSALSVMRSGAAKVASIFEKLFSVLKKVTKTAISLGIDGAKAVGRFTASITGGAIKAVGKLGSAIGAVIRKMNDLSGITKMFSNANIFGKIQKALKKIATLTVFMYLRTTIRNLMGSVREGLDNIVQVSEKANAALSSFATNVTYLKNAFAAMVTPILYAVYPAIERLVNVIAHAANMIAAFFAAITGQKTFTRAKRVQEDYAASLNKTSSAAGKLHKQLAGFDDLNNLTTSQGNDADVPSIADMFEEVEVPDNIKSIADKIRDILKTDDWSEIGKMIAGKLNLAMAKIPWDKIEEEAQRIAKGIGTLINGFVDELDWSLLGETIAKGLNTALHFANTLLETINFEKIGESLATAFKSFMEVFDWDALGKFLANKYNSIIDLTHGFLKEMVDAWYTFGEKIGEAVDSFFNQMHLDKAFEIVSYGLNGIADFINGFVDKWIGKARGWGNKVGYAIANMFDMIQWENIGRAFSNSLRLLSETTSGVLDGMEGKWRGIGHGLSQTIQNAFDAKVFAQAGSVISRSVNGIIEVFQNLFANMHMWENVGRSLGLFVDNIVNGIDWYAASDTIVNFVHGFTKAVNELNTHIQWDELAESLSAAVEHLINDIDWEAAGKAFASLIENIFSVIMSIDWNGLGYSIGVFLGQIPWTKILGDVFEIIWQVLSGLLRGLLDTKNGRAVILLFALLNALKLLLTKALPAALIFAFASFTGVFDKIAAILSGGILAAGTPAMSASAATLAGGFGTAATKSFGGVFATLGAKITGLASGMFAKLGALFSSLGSGLAAILTNPYVIAAAVIAAIVIAIILNWDKLSAALVRLRSKFRVFKNELKEKFAPALKELGDKFKEFGNNLKEKISDGLDKATEKLKGFAGDLKDKVGKGLENFGEKIKGFADGIKDKISNGLEKAGESVKGFAEKFGNGIKDGIEKAENRLKEFANGIEGKIKDGLEKASEKVRDFADGIKDKIKGGLDEAGNKIQEFGDNARSKIENGLNKAAEKAKEFGDSLKNKVGDGVDKAGEKVKGFVDKVKEYFGISQKINNEQLDPFGNQKPLTGRGGGVNVFGMLVEAVSENLEKIRNIVDSTWSSIKENSITAWNGITSSVAKAWDNIKSGYVAAWNGVKSVASTALTELKDVYVNAWNGIKASAITAFTEIKNVIDGSWNGIKSAAESAWNAISASLQSIWNNISQAASNAFNSIKDAVRNAWETLKTETVNAWNAISGALSNAWDTLKSLAASAFNAISDTISGVWNAIQTATASAWNAIQGLLSGVWNWIASTAASVFSTISSAVSSAWDAIQNATASAWNNIQTLLTNAWNAISSAATTIFNGIADAIRGVFETINGIAQKIAETLSRLAQEAMNKAREMMSNLANAIRDGVGNVGNAIGNVVGTISNALGGLASKAFEIGKSICGKIAEGLQNAAGAVSNAIGGIANGISNALGSAANKASEIVGNIKNAVKDLPSALSNAVDTGKNIVSGIANGIKNAASTAYDAASKVASGIVNTTRQKLKLRSPSRVFIEIGENIVQGLNNGIERMAASTDNVVNNWIDGFKDVDAPISLTARLDEIKGLSPNLGSEIDLQRSLAMQNNVSLDGSEIKNLVHAIEMMTMQDQAAMRQQTEYLQQIARKEFTIGQRDVFSAVQNEAVAYEMRTGQPAFGY